MDLFSSNLPNFCPTPKTQQKQTNQTKAKQTQNQPLSDQKPTQNQRKTNGTNQTQTKPTTNQKQTKPSQPKQKTKQKKQTKNQPHLRSHLGHFRFLLPRPGLSTSDAKPRLECSTDLSLGPALGHEGRSTPGGAGGASGGAVLLAKNQGVHPPKPSKTWCFLFFLVFHGLG